MEYNVKFQKMSPDAQIPYQGSEAAAGYDLYSVGETRLEPGEIALVPLGFGTEMPTEIHGRIESRSGMALKGLVVITGVIDSDYRGEWKVIMGNFSGEVVRIAPGSRVAQVVFRPTVKVAFEAVEELTETVRGAGGFGHTGS